MKLQSETETQRNILKGEMNMLFQTESGQTVGPIGQGTWYLGEDPDRFDAECSALRAGVEAGMNLIDTAEMYGDGAAEELVGRAIQGLDRDKLFLVSKVYPFNAGRGDIRVSCEDSLMRMKTDHLDLYLLHWRGSVPLAETVECMEELKEDGLIRAWGVSNLDTDDMQELFAQPDGTHCAANQVLYNVGSRGIEYDLLPLMRQHQIPVMAYCPLAQAGRLRRGLLNHPALRQIAGEHHATVPQILLAFLLAQPGVLPIPGRAAHSMHSRTRPQRRSACRQKSLHCWTLRSPSRNARPGWRSSDPAVQKLKQMKRRCFAAFQKVNDLRI